MKKHLLIGLISLNIISNSFAVVVPVSSAASHNHRQTENDNFQSTLTISKEEMDSKIQFLICRANISNNTCNADNESYNFKTKVRPLNEDCESIFKYKKVLDECKKEVWNYFPNMPINDYIKAKNFNEVIEQSILIKQGITYFLFKVK